MAVNVNVAVELEVKVVVVDVVVGCREFGTLSPQSPEPLNPKGV